MTFVDKNSQTRLKRKLVIDSETETESSPAFKKKLAANSSSSPTDGKNTGSWSLIPDLNVL